MPDGILARHGARILRPGDVVTAASERIPSSTVYRSGTLLVADDVIRDPSTWSAMNSCLEHLGVELMAPPPQCPKEYRSAPQNGRSWAAAFRVPQRVLLRPATATRPVRIDAWVVLQHLLSAMPDLAGSVSLEHILFGSTASIVGDPFTEGSSLSGGPLASDGSGVLSGYSSPGWGGRAPVQVIADPAARRPLHELNIGRRPVVAVLDTGVGSHPWLPWSIRPEDHAFVTVDMEIATLVAEGHLWSQTYGITPIVSIEGPWEGVTPTSSLLGTVESHHGHGTFIAGIVRQVAPQAAVRSVRIMHNDGVVYEGDLLIALGTLASRMSQAQADRGGEIVDVVSLSLGYFDESADDALYTAFPLRQLIDHLVGLGVTIVASAGNNATTRSFYPAALAMTVGDPRRQAGAQTMVSVGALNPNGSKALFSNDGDWVTDWDAGVAMVSTFPRTVQGSVNPAARSRVVDGTGRREALDIDDFTSGYAVWSGTSFSAPLVAARLIAKLIDMAAHAAVDLTDTNPAVMRRRSEAAMGMVRAEQAARAQAERVAEEEAGIAIVDAGRNP